MNKDFKKLMDKLPSLYRELDSAPLYKMSEAKFPKSKAIYVFCDESGKELYVGRTCNLQARLRGHVQKNHYSASFAFKEARKNAKITQERHTRSSLAKGELKEQFEQSITRVRKMKVKYLEVLDSRTQYLLELYATIEYRLDESGFDTH